MVIKLEVKEILWQGENTSLPTEAEIEIEVDAKIADLQEEPTDEFMESVADALDSKYNAEVIGFILEGFAVDTKDLIKDVFNEYKQELLDDPDKMDRQIKNLLEMKSKGEKYNQELLEWCLMN